MAYGGESDAKRIARYQLWKKITANRLPMIVFDPRCRILVLTGPTAADLRMLRGNGRTDLSLVTAIDVDDECTRKARDAFPGADIQTGDIFKAACDRRRSFDVMVLDFCSQLNERSVDYLARCVAFGARDGAVVVAAFSYGRESASRSAFITEHATDVVDMSTDGVRTPQLTSIYDIDSRASAAGARVMAARQWTTQAFRSVGCWFCIESAVAYVSATESKVGTPMIYIVGRVHRTPTVGADHIPILCVESRPTQARQQIRRVASALAAQGTPASEVGDMLNLDAKTVIAWKAVSTARGEVVAGPLPTSISMIDAAGSFRRAREEMATWRADEDRSAAALNEAFNAARIVVDRDTAEAHAAFRLALDAFAVDRDLAALEAAALAGDLSLAAIDRRWNAARKNHADGLAMLLRRMGERKLSKR